MRHILSVIVVAALLVATAVDVIAGWEQNGCNAKPLRCTRD